MHPEPPPLQPQYGPRLLLLSRPPRHLFWLCIALLLLQSTAAIAASAGAAAADPQDGAAAAAWPGVPAAARRPAATAYLPSCAAGGCNARGVCRTGMQLKKCRRETRTSAEDEPRDRLQQEVTSCGVGACGERQDIMDVNAAAANPMTK